MHQYIYIYIIHRASLMHANQYIYIYIYILYTEHLSCLTQSNSHALCLIASTLLLVCASLSCAHTGRVAVRELHRSLPGRAIPAIRRACLGSQHGHSHASPALGVKMIFFLSLLWGNVFFIIIISILMLLRPLGW